MTPSTHTTDSERAGATVLSIWRGLIEPEAPSRPLASMRAIATVIASEYGFTLEALRGPRTDSDICRARHHVIAEIRSTRQFSDVQVGRFMGRDRTMVRRAQQAHERRVEAEG